MRRKRTAMVPGTSESWLSRIGDGLMLVCEWGLRILGAVIEAWLDV